MPSISFHPGNRYAKVYNVASLPSCMILGTLAFIISLTYFLQDILRILANKTSELHTTQDEAKNLSKLKKIQHLRSLYLFKHSIPPAIEMTICITICCCIKSKHISKVGMFFMMYTAMMAICYLLKTVHYKGTILGIKYHDESLRSCPTCAIGSPIDTSRIARGGDDVIHDKSNISSNVIFEGVMRILSIPVTALKLIFNIIKLIAHVFEFACISPLIIYDRVNSIRWNNNKSSILSGMPTKILIGEANHKHTKYSLCSYPGTMCYTSPAACIRNVAELLVNSTVIGAFILNPSTSQNTKYQKFARFIRGTHEGHSL